MSEIVDYIVILPVVLFLILVCYKYAMAVRAWNAFVNEPENQPFNIPALPGGATKVVSVPFEQNQMVPNALQMLTSQGIPVTQADLDHLVNQLGQSGERLKNLIMNNWMIAFKLVCCKSENMTSEVMLAAQHRTLDNLNRSYFSDRNIFVEFWATRSGYQGHYPPMVTSANEIKSDCIRFHYYGQFQAPTAGVTNFANPAILSPGGVNPAILSPGVANPAILSPGVPNPVNMSPGVPNPVYLSPGVPNPAYLSPGVSSGLAQPTPVNSYPSFGNPY